LASLRFYFDFISHNAYLAWTQLPALAERTGNTIEPVPVLFAGLLDAHGQLGPAEIPAKLRWMTRDVLRKARRLGIPLRAPAFHPFNPLPTLRVASLPLPAAERARLVTVLFEATWTRSLAVGEPQVVAAVLDEAGLDGAGLLERANSPAYKGRLREQTDAAIGRGVFGVPTVEAAGELFWGFDDLAHLEACLRGDDPLSAEELEAWQRVPRAAERKRPR
jgi:2-hydroxychromene-2-carboxylate isomerase